MSNLDAFYDTSHDIVERFNTFAVKHNLSGRATPDHICYKCGSKESYDRLREMLESESEYIFQSIISKRRIAIIRFKKSIETDLGPINFLELSDQKARQFASQVDGFDHIEAYPVGRSYDDMVKEFEQTEYVIKVERPHHTTHDIDMGGGFLFRCTLGPLIEKIKNSEMV